MIIVATHHKTGHHLLGNIFRETSSPMVYYDASSMSEIPDDAEIILYEQDSKKGVFSAYGCEIEIEKYGEVRGIHSIRHPYEVVVSGYNWHMSIDAEWVNEEREGGMSYKQHLMQPDGILYEMRNRAAETIRSMYEWDYDDERFLNVKMEDFWEDYKGTIEMMADHLGLSFDMSRNRGFNIRSNIPSYATNRTGEKWKWPSTLTERHKEVFADIFPPDIFDKLGYTGE